VPCRRSRAEEIGSTSPGGKAAGVHCVSTNEVSHYSVEDEEVTGETCSSVVGEFHPEQSYGGDTETPSSAE
jgi:hypothetical protein